MPGRIHSAKQGDKMKESTKTSYTKPALTRHPRWEILTGALISAG